MRTSDMHQTLTRTIAGLEVYVVLLPQEYTEPWCPEPGKERALLLASAYPTAGYDIRCASSALHLPELATETPLAHNGPIHYKTYGVVAQALITDIINGYLPEPVQLLSYQAAALENWLPQTNNAGALTCSRCWALVRDDQHYLRMHRDEHITAGRLNAGMDAEFR